MSKNPRFFRCLPGLAAAYLLLTACGIEEYEILAPPNPQITTGDDKFEFQKTTSNSGDEFRGFDLYYKILPSTETPSVDVYIYEDLAARGYKRIHASTDRISSVQKPLIGIDANDRIDDPRPGPVPENPLPDPPWFRTNDAFTLTVDFTGTVSTIDPPFPQIVDDGSPLLIDEGDTALPSPPPILIEITDIRRGVTYDESEGSHGLEDEYKRFSKFSALDIGRDITGAVWNEISSDIAVQIVVYAVSYGFAFTGGAFKVLYSEPVYLGVVSRFFPYIE
jgi:hypothetical protein